MKKYCKIIGIATLVLGSIGSVIIAYKLGVTLEGNYYVHVERNWGLTLLYFVVGILVTFFETVIFLSLGEILERLELIDTKCNSNTDNVNDNSIRNYYETRSAQPIVARGKVVIAADWKCSKCGRTNASYTGTCACGNCKE